MGTATRKKGDPVALEISGKGLRLQPAISQKSGKVYFVARLTNQSPGQAAMYGAPVGPSFFAGLPQTATVNGVEIELALGETGGGNPRTRGVATVSIDGTDYRATVQVSQTPSGFCIMATAHQGKVGGGGIKRADGVEDFA